MLTTAGGVASELPTNERSKAMSGVLGLSWCISTAIVFVPLTKAEASILNVRGVVPSSVAEEAFVCVCGS